jgi:hypothetical protein
LEGVGEGCAVERFLKRKSPFCFGDGENGNYPQKLLDVFLRRYARKVLISE